jgi:hypothetical protein
MLGYRGHFVTKSRRYSTTMRGWRTTGAALLALSAAARAGEHRRIAREEVADAP